MVKSGKVFDILKEACPTISPGIISADLMSLGSQVSTLGSAGLDMVHFDVMDGHFFPSLTVGAPFIKAVKTELLKDVHLMVTGVEKKTAEFVAAGADIVTAHIEALDDPVTFFKELGGMENVNDPTRGIVRGVGVNPATPVEDLEPLLGEIELVLLLAVDPAEGNHPSFGATRERFEKIKQMIAASGREILVCVDGGVKKSNIGEYAKMGADIYVSGSALFSGPIKENVRFMLDALRFGAGRGTN